MPCVKTTIPAPDTGNGGDSPPDNGNGDNGGEDGNGGDGNNGDSDTDLVSQGVPWLVALGVAGATVYGYTEDPQGRQT